jgi:hypothetical protein
MPKAYKTYTLNVQNDPKPNGVLENTNFKKLIDKDEALSIAVENLETNSIRTISAVAPIHANSSSGQVEISHDESGIEPGEYRAVIVDSTGHVTGGSSVLSFNPLYLCEVGHEEDLTTVRIWNDGGIVKIQMQSIVGTWDIELWRFERIL